jgi:hypothetical protein
MKPITLCLCVPLTIAAAQAQTQTLPRSPAHHRAAARPVQIAFRGGATAADGTTATTVSGNIAYDLDGPADTRAACYGTAEAWDVPIVFTPPAGYQVVVDRLLGDVVAWPLAGAAVNVPPSGVLAGFTVASPDVTPAGQSTAQCSYDLLCTAAAPVYVQQHVPPAGATRTFDVPAGVTLTDGTITAVVASWLNLYGVKVHIELTYMIRVHLVKETA